MGDRQHPDGLRPLPDRLQHLGDRPRGSGAPGAVARPPGPRRGLALRQGALRLRARARRRPLPHAPRARGARARRGDLGAGSRDGCSAAPALREPVRTTTRSPSSPPASSRTRRPSPGASSSRPQAAAPSSAAAAPGSCSSRCARRSPTSSMRDVIVVAGDRDVRDLAGVLELRIRKAVRRGAQLILARRRRHAARPARERAHRDAPRAEAFGSCGRACRTPDALPRSPCCSSPIRSRSSMSRRSPRAAAFRTSPAGCFAAARGAERARRARRRLPRRPGRRPRSRRARRAAHAGHARGCRPRSRGPTPSAGASACSARSRSWSRRCSRRGDALGARGPARRPRPREGRHQHNLEGRAQRLSPGAPPPAGVVPSSRCWRARRAGSGRRCPATRPRVTGARGGRARALPRLGGDRDLPVRPARRAAATGEPGPSGARLRATGGLRSCAVPPLLSGPACERAERLRLPAARRDRARRMPTPNGCGLERRAQHDRARAARGWSHERPAADPALSTAGVVRVPWAGAPRVTGGAASRRGAGRAVTSSSSRDQGVRPRQPR